MAGSDLVVFTGPTLGAQECAAHLPEALVLPPADQGAVYYAVRELRARRIVLIDGMFGAVPAVRHKEIVWALHQGCAVLGAASMGALRAADLWRQGMVGHGAIYRWYRAVPLAPEDEVAVAMAPVELGCVALSEALVNIRATLRRAEGAGVIGREERLALVALARGHPFSERSLAASLEEACAASVISRSRADTLGDWFAEHAVDLKRRDALGLLARVAAGEAAHTVPAGSAPPLTETWIRDLLDGGLTPP
jgi:hypothetical protein